VLRVILILCGVPLAHTTNMSYRLLKGDTTMDTKEQVQIRLNDLRREFRGVSSILEMMEKGTKREDLAKLRSEKLEPIRREIKRLEEELANLAGL
jgi:hypothetical protein